MRGTPHPFHAKFARGMSNSAPSPYENNEEDAKGRHCVGCPSNSGPRADLHDCMYRSIRDLMSNPDFEARYSGVPCEKLPIPVPTQMEWNVQLKITNSKCG